MATSEQSYRSVVSEVFDAIDWSNKTVRDYGHPVFNSDYHCKIFRPKNAMLALGVMGVMAGLGVESDDLEVVRGEDDFGVFLQLLIKKGAGIDEKNN